MTSTLVRDSLVGDDWIRQSCASVPMQKLMNPQTGMFTGDIITGPVRLQFDNLWELPTPKAGQNSITKFGATLLFTPLAVFDIMYEEYYRMCGQVFPEFYDAQSQQYHGLHSPFHNQAEKLRFGGFTPNAVYINSTSKYKPPIVDNRHNPVVDRNKVYSGAWAICVINAYSYGKSPPQPKKGIGFGLQSVMLIGDDTRLGKQGPDAKQQFAGINISAPIVRPEMVQNMPVGAPPPAGGIAGYTMPGGGVPRPGMPAPIPQVHYQGMPMPHAPMGEDEDMSFLN